MTRRMNGPPTGSYWPHAGIAFGLLLNAAGLAVKNSELVATGTNVCTISLALYLGQRRRAKDD